MYNAQPETANTEGISLHELIKALQKAHQLVVYRGLLQDHVVKSYLCLLEALISYPPAVPTINNAYHDFVHNLIMKETPGKWPDAWQRYLVSAILADENPFSRQAEHVSFQEISPNLIEAARHDLACLQQMFQTSSRSIRKVAIERMSREMENCDSISLLSWEAMSSGQDSPVDSMVLFNSDHWENDIEAVAAYYRAHGTGIFQRFHAFRWEKRGDEGCLTGISRPDAVNLGELIGLQRQREALETNTRYFLAGLPASHVLLYGPRGTGKTTMVKSLLNAYSDRGLRIIELPKQHLSDLPAIFNLLCNRALRFIIFVDDLSFEDYEVDYKVLKTVLEGGIERRPDNVLIYATSNRRHIVKEMFSDRAAEEMHGGDSVQEKLSLADRFGMTITFPYPSERSYLEIVRGLAARYHIDLSDDELVKRALQWEKSHSGPSGRTARQFVDHLVAEAGLKRGKQK